MNEPPPKKKKERKRDRKRKEEKNVGKTGTVAKLGKDTEGKEKEKRAGMWEKHEKGDKLS